MGSISNRHGDSDRRDEVSTVDIDQSVQPDDVEERGDGLVSDMDIDEDDVLPPPPSTR